MENHSLILIFLEDEGGAVWFVGLVKGAFIYLVSGEKSFIHLYLHKESSSFHIDLFVMFAIQMSL